MSKIGDYKNFNGLDKNYFKWFAIYITIGLILSFTLPFPISLLAYIMIVMILQTSRLRKMQENYKSSKSVNFTKNTENKGLGGAIRSISDWLYNDPYGSFGPKPLRFVCMNCGKQHKERKCPSCGSGAVKIE
jgi:hypothetical protein